jgi:hypothetical protein
MEMETAVLISDSRAAWARYIVVNGVVKLLAVDSVDVDGLSERLEPSGNPAAVAARLARKWARTQPRQSDFNRALKPWQAPY